VCDIYEEIEHASREETMKYGGSISHHHGVGKLRKRFMEKSFTDIKVQNTMYGGLKKALDPNNVFAVNNTIFRSEEERNKDINHKVTLP